MAHDVLENGSGDESVNVGDPDARGRRMTPWAWVPSVYYLQGLQYALVTQLFVIVFFTMGVPTGETLLMIGLLQLPWTLKPLWGPLIDRYWTKRAWTITMQLIVGVLFLGAAFTLTLPGNEPIFPGFQAPLFFWVTCAVLFLMAVAAGTHDIACDGYYMMALSEKKQAFYVGVRSTFFRLALIVGNGILLVVADAVLGRSGLEPQRAQFTGGDSPAAITAEASTPPAPGELGIVLEPARIVLDRDAPTTLTVRLTQPPPDEERIVTLGVAGGGILDIIGIGPGRFVSIPQQSERLVFNAENWDTGIDVPISSDRATPPDLSGYISARSGDYALAWAIVSLVCGASFLLLAFWHTGVLPRAVTDVVDTEGRPPFILPLGVILGTVIVPFLVGYFIYYEIDAWFGEALRAQFLPANPTELQTKGFEFGFAISRLALISAIPIVLFTVPGVREPARSGFKSLSDLSGIGFFDVFATFFTKTGMAATIGFLLTFRLGEAQLAVMKNVFLLDGVDGGGVAMTLGQLAFTNTVVYLGFLTIGGLLGGWLISVYGLKKVVWPMVAFMHLPNVPYIYLAYAQPDNFLLVNAVVGFESFGYGIGFTAYLMVMILAAQGPYKTAHYALCTGLMALGFMIPSMWAGFLQELVGYTTFFLLVMLFTIPGIAFIFFLNIDPNFGRKTGQVKS